MNERSYKVLAVLMVCLVAASSAGVYYAVQDQEDEYVSAQPEMMLGKDFLSPLVDTLSSGIIQIADMITGGVGGDYRIIKVNGTTPAASDSNEVKVFARESVRASAANDFAAWCISSAGLVDNNARTWGLAESYTDRAAEIAAGSLWSKGTAYDSEAVLMYAGVYSLTADSLFNTNVSLGYGVRNIADRLSDWTGAYDTITASLAWNGGSTPDCTDSCSVDFTSIVISGDGQRVFFGGSNTDSPVWVLSSATVTMKSDAGTEIRLEPGKHTDEIPTGWYTLSAGTYGGLFLPSPGGNSASVSGGAVIGADGTYGYAVPKDGGLTVSWEGKQYTTSYLKYRWSSDGKTTETQTVDGSDPLAYLITKYGAQTEAIVNVLAKSAQAGQTMWSISAQAGSSNILLSPSSISPRLTNVGVDANQSYALYVLALSQISDYWKSYGTQLTASQTKISSESLDLYIKGTIYCSDGTVAVSDAVFTPYVYLKNMTVQARVNNTFNQDGTCMVWTSGFIDDLSEFAGSEPEKHKYVIMPEGSYFTAEEVMYGGHAAADLTLHVKEIGKIDTLSDLDPDGTPQPPKVLDADMLCMIIVLELGALIAAIGLYFRQPLIIVAGAIVALLGIVAKDWVADLMLGWFGK